MIFLDKSTLEISESVSPKKTKIKEKVITNRPVYNRPVYNGPVYNRAVYNGPVYNGARVRGRLTPDRIALGGAIIRARTVNMFVGARGYSADKRA